MTMLNWSAVPATPKGVLVTAVGINGRAEMVFPNVNLEYMRAAAKAYREDGALIQTAFARLTSDEREFLMTGLTPDAWNALFSEDEGDFEDDLP